MKKIINMLVVIAILMAGSISSVQAQYSTNQQPRNKTVWQNQSSNHHDNGKHKGWYKHKGNKDNDRNDDRNDDRNWRNNRNVNNQPVWFPGKNNNVRRNRENEQGDDREGNNKRNGKGHGKKDKDND